MNAFQKTAITTLFAVLLLVAVGSLVRVSGAGLGCPDWPKCWGCWFPPSGPDAIDPAYLEARGLSRADFNPVKMWIEYINRLIGVLIGLCVLATFVRSVPYRKNQPGVFWGALFAVFLVGFEGWLGGQVVRSGLKPGIITLHMIGAVVLLCVLLCVTFQAVKVQLDIVLSPALRRRFTLIAGLLFGVICLQVLLGTQVREAIDPYIKDPGDSPRNIWITHIGFIDHLHRAFTWPVLISVGYLIYTVQKQNISGLLRVFSRLVLILILAQTAFGIALAYGGLPHVFQVLHLVTSTVLVCGVFALLLTVRQTRAVSPVQQRSAP